MHEKLIWICSLSLQHLLTSPKSWNKSGECRLKSIATGNIFGFIDSSKLVKWTKAYQQSCALGTDNLDSASSAANYCECDNKFQLHQVAHSVVALSNVVH